MEDDRSWSGLWNQFTGEVLDFLTDTRMWQDAGVVLVRIVLIWLVSRLALLIVSRIIDHVTASRSHRVKLRTRRVQTLGRLLKNTASYTVNFVVLLLVLGEFRIDLAPLLAGAGVIGLAIGFGAQSLVKDVITGFFILFEDQFAVGDHIQTGNFRGTVEMIGLRSTRLRSWTGEVHIIPNGSIVEVTNYSVYNSLAVVDIPFPYEERVEEAIELVRGVLARFEDARAAGAPELLGVQSMDASGVVLRVTVECKPNMQVPVSRKLNEEVKKAFEERGMEAPYPRMVTVQKGEARERTGG